MELIDTPIDGAYLLEPRTHRDERGFFARTYCESTFRDLGLEPPHSQTNVSRSAKAGTLRGFHWQDPPFGEAKLVKCTRGRIFDAIVDARPRSPTFRSWFGRELGDDSLTMMYIPAGVAHAYLTLEDDSEILYQVSSPYTPESERTAAWDDPTIGVAWPRKPSVLSTKDAAAGRFPA